MLKTCLTQFRWTPIQNYTKFEHVEGEFRVIYIAKHEEAIYVLHSFQKKAQKTPKKDIDITNSSFGVHLVPMFYEFRRVRPCRTVT
ncbi:MAG: type II toxin-antitoxin system RelE/ParE family toxin [Candidatus Thiodiazotropha sp. (ex Dulcina madagascariensis)]|nr:type II toxin-antitoxin system RelE/ParE family toxin [Candidatus Thiodiazotropha sp. (ex Dulcina madagascariensis)]